MQQPTPQLPSLIYATITGPVDQSMVQRVFQSFAVAINGGVKVAHVVFQTTGGTIAEGIALYNYFRALPIDLHFYNVGTVASIGVVVFLGAQHRFASANSTFMIHKSTYNPQTPTNADRASGMADALKIEDERTQAILEANLTISKRKIDKHRVTELPFNAKGALDCGLVHEIREFVLPSGNILSNI